MNSTTTISSCSNKQVTISCHKIIALTLGKRVSIILRECVANFYCFCGKVDVILQFTVIRCWWLCSNQWTDWYRYSIKPLNRFVDLSKQYRSTLSSECQMETMSYFLLITLIPTKLFPNVTMAFPFQNGSTAKLAREMLSLPYSF